MGSPELSGCGPLGLEDTWVGKSQNGSEKEDGEEDPEDTIWVDDVVERQIGEGTDVRMHRRKEVQLESGADMRECHGENN